MRTLRAIALGALFAAVPLAAQAEVIPFTSKLDSQSEVPPRTSHARGALTGELDTATGALTYRIEYQGLLGPVVAAHFHGPADVGQVAGPRVTIAAAASPISGAAALTPDQVAELRAGQWYVNLHTARNPAGEIRGQVLEVQPSLSSPVATGEPPAMAAPAR